MRKPTPWSSLAVAVGLCLTLPFAVAAQTETPDEPPVLEDVAWQRSIDLSGAEIQATLDDDEIAAWGTMLDDAGGSFEQLEYTFHAAFDTTALPQIGGIATVSVAGSDQSALLAAVVADIVAQVEGAGAVAPAPQAARIGDKDVVLLDLPSDFGFDLATIYARDDVAWVLMMPEEHVGASLDQLP